jgi:hypothetical protein
VQLVGRGYMCVYYIALYWLIKVFIERILDVY